jgi:hypothetical protein
VFKPIETRSQMPRKCQICWQFHVIQRFGRVSQCERESNKVNRHMIHCKIRLRRSTLLQYRHPMISQRTDFVATKPIVLFRTASQETADSCRLTWIWPSCPTRKAKPLSDAKQDFAPSRHNAIALYTESRQNTFGRTESCQI